MDVELSPDAANELRALPAAERRAVVNALEKLRSAGTQLGHPHSSQVRGTNLRELRPRAGRSPWRAIYRQFGNTLIILAIAPEAHHDSRGFDRGITAAQQRFTDLEAKRKTGSP